MVNREAKENGYHLCLHFDNGFGLSIISREGSYGYGSGFFEVGLLKDKGLVYNRDFPDVKGWLDFGEVDRLIKMVKAYEPSTYASESMNYGMETA